MPEINRTRDSLIFVKGIAFTVHLDQTLADEGWTGGTGVKYVASADDEFLVTRSDGEMGGFLLWGSDEVPDKFTGMTLNQVVYKFGVIGVGGWLISTLSFETNTYASRQSGPLVPIAYNASDRLFFSLGGLWTIEDEWDLSGDPRAPNPNIVGAVAQVPSPELNNHMTVQVIL